MRIAAIPNRAASTQATRAAGSGLPSVPVRFLVAAVLVAIALPATARAGEIQADLGYSVRKSTWRGDVSAGAQLGLGYRFARVLAVDFVGWNELATVDKRFLTGLSFGLTGSIPRKGARPNLRLYFIHQHEEGWVSVAEHPFGALAGIGPGIRHRAGVGARLGVEIPISEKKKHLEWFVQPAIDTTWFPDASLGPAVYVAATIGLGFNYTLEELP